MENRPFSRRGFLATLSSFVGLAAVFGFSGLAKAEERRRGGGEAPKASGGAKELEWPLVVPGKDTAVAVSYETDKKKVTKAELKVDRQGVKFADQHCGVCGFYKEVGTKDGKKVGTCTIFPNKLVENPAWCASWNKKS